MMIFYTSMAGILTRADVSHDSLNNHCDPGAHHQSPLG